LYSGFPKDTDIQKESDIKHIPGYPIFAVYLKHKLKINYMTNKTTRIISLVLMGLTSLSLVMSAVMKLTAAKQVVEGLGKAGLGNFITIIGVIELLSVILLWIPKTSKIGFLLLCSYLGGAICIELAGGQAPSAAIFLAVLWVAVYLRDKSIFLQAAGAESK
jgi:CBS domain containing-hemolysin-like protein